MKLYFDLFLRNWLTAYFIPMRWALTQGNWIESFANGVYTATNLVTQTTAENDAYTLKTPKNLDPTREWTLYYQADVTPDGSALVLEIFTGFADNFVVTGDAGTIGATSGAKYADLIDDVVAAVPPLIYSWKLDPRLNVADVVTVAAIATGLKMKIPVAPYYAFNLNATSTLNAAVNTFTIVQKFDDSDGTDVATVRS